MAGVTVAENPGVERTSDLYPRDFMLFTVPIYCHAKSAYASQGFYDEVWKRGWDLKFYKVRFAHSKSQIETKHHTQ
jgi:hypothetical protein